MSRQLHRHFGSIGSSKSASSGEPRRRSADRVRGRRSFTGCYLRFWQKLFLPFVPTVSTTRSHASLRSASINQPSALNIRGFGKKSAVPWGTINARPAPEPAESPEPAENPERVEGAKGRNGRFPFPHL